MAITVRELLDTFDDKLLLRTPPEDEALDQVINWAAPTELKDPTPFVVGKELILTTGISLKKGNPGRYQQFIKKLTSAGTTALGFGSGLSHKEIPSELLVSARKLGLPVIEVPYETPFIEISRVIAESVIAERFELLRHGLDIHERLAKVLIDGGDLFAIVDRLHRLIEGPVAVIDIHGRLLAGSPTTSEWPLEITNTKGSQVSGDKKVHTTPIVVDGELTAHRSSMNATTSWIGGRALPQPDSPTCAASHD